MIDLTKMDDEAIDKISTVYKELISSMDHAHKIIAEIKARNRPTLQCERYYTGTELMGILHISRRTLQEYRDKRLLPYTKLGNGVILYPESHIMKILERNYIKPAFYNRR